VAINGLFDNSLNLKATLVLILIGSAAQTRSAANSINTVQRLLHTTKAQNKAVSLFNKLSPLLYSLAKL
jgi:hypothetical protein